MSSTGVMMGRASVAKGMRGAAEGLQRTTSSAGEVVVCLNMSFWKRRRIGELLRSSGRTPLFRRNARAAVMAARAHGGELAVWTSRAPPELAALAASHQVPLVCVEDGFVRSVGLGADFFPPLSIVLDRRGIYFDPSRPSDLEAILAETDFTPELVERAGRLARTIVERRLSKYNTGLGLDGPMATAGRRAIFVPGQVEDDLSVVRGGAGVTGNLDLLGRVRAANPDAYLVYKPHPDVEAGHRAGAVADAEVLRFADRIVRGATVASIIAGVDEVHTLTSLCGFEALLRGRRVVVYGQPFYAGWGLTEDLAPIARRVRRLSLEQLVAGALILYPRYFDPVTRRLCEVETALDRLSDPSLWRPNLLVRLRRLEGALRGRWQARRIRAAAGTLS